MGNGDGYTAVFVLALVVGLPIGAGIHWLYDTKYSNECAAICGHKRVTACGLTGEKIYAICAEPEGKFALEVKP